MAEWHSTPSLSLGIGDESKVWIVYNQKNENIHSTFIQEVIKLEKQNDSTG